VLRLPAPDKAGRAARFLKNFPLCLLLFFAVIRPMFSQSGKSAPTATAARATTTTAAATTAAADDAAATTAADADADADAADAVRAPGVTVLCGFLGAGKTTMLNHLLAQAEAGAEGRWAAIVNDVASVNIDAAVVRARAGGAAVREIVGLGNGCVCCSSRDDLAETIAALAAGGGGPAGGPLGGPLGGMAGRTAGESAGGAAGRIEHIFVETSGVALPRGVAELFTRKNPFGRSLSDFARLTALVSVVDAPHFLREWEAGRAAPAVVVDASRPVFELMVEQVECADVIVLNKCDLVDGGDDLARLEEIVRGLNPRATLTRAERGRVPVELLLGRRRFDANATLSAASWIRALNNPDADADTGAAAAPAAAAPAAAAKPVARRAGAGGAGGARPEDFGITSFVYRARRPFAGEKFRALLAAPGALPGLLRAKGFFWIGERPDEMGFLSVAGGVTRFDFPGWWWAAMRERGIPGWEAPPKSLRKIWLPPHGDRRQELVFIGVCLDEPSIRARLDACLA
jgi:G3E family GTPase